MTGSEKNPVADDSANSFQKNLKQARDGDVSVAGQLLQEYRNYMLKIANKEVDQAVQKKVAASDIVQESMLTAHQNIDQFQGDSKSEFKAWLRQIVINDVGQAAGQYRTQKRQINREQPMVLSSSLDLGLSDPGKTPGTTALADEEAGILNAAIQRLPEDYRQVLQMRNWQDQSFEQIGAAMRRSPDAARKLWTRALLALEKLLETGAS